MEVKYAHQFAKELDKIKDNEIKLSILAMIEIVEKVGIYKMQATNDVTHIRRYALYEIRVGKKSRNYRILCTMKNEFSEKIMSVKDLKKELFKDKGFKKYFEQNKSSYEIAASVIKARISRGLSQEALAKKIRTKQPSIARLERGSYLPSLGFLEKIAAALDTELILPKFKFLENENNPTPVNIIWNFNEIPYEEKFKSKEYARTAIVEI